MLFVATPPMSAHALCLNWQSCQSPVGSPTKTKLESGPEQEQEHEIYLTRKLHKYKRNTRTCKLDEHGKEIDARLAAASRRRSKTKPAKKLQAKMHR